MSSIYLFLAILLLSMETKKNTGVLLQAIPYLGKGRILKVFSESEGLITLIAKNRPELSSPFCIAEWVYRKGPSPLFNLTDGSILDSLSGLRESYEALTAAGSIAQDILKTQLEAKSAPNLYLLLSSYFKKIPLFKTPSVLALSFRIKLLLHEGLLTLSASCSYCEERARYLMQGESVCANHAGPKAFPFSLVEWSCLLELAFAKKFSFLEELSCPSSLNEKMGSLFKERMSL